MQTLDPKVGTQRQKGLLQRIAQKAVANKSYKAKIGKATLAGRWGKAGYNSSVGTFGKTAGRGGIATSARGLGPGKHGPAHALPGQLNNVFDGLGGQYSPGANGYLNTAPVQADTPDSYDTGYQDATDTSSPDPAPVTPSDLAQGVIDSGLPLTQTGLTPDQLTQIHDTPLTQTGLTPDQLTQINDIPLTQTGLTPDQFQQIHDMPLTQSAPSAPISSPGGLIPLGNGMYYDPVTDAIHGGGGLKG